MHSNLRLTRSRMRCGTKPRASDGTRVRMPTNDLPHYCKKKSHVENIVTAECVSDLSTEKCFSSYF
jgi:hypothetical protein